MAVTATQTHGPEHEIGGVQKRCRRRPASVLSDRGRAAARFLATDIESNQLAAFADSSLHALADVRNLM